MAAAVATVLFAAPGAHATPPSNTPALTVAAPYGGVHAVVVSGSTAYVAGDFTGTDAVVTGSLMSLPTSSTGRPASTWPQVDGRVNAVVGDGAGGWYLGGSFTTVGGTARANLAHITAAGSLDASFDPTTDDRVDALALSGDGSTLYVGGAFTTVNGTTTRNYLAAFSTSTGTATSFDPDMDSDVFALALSSDGSTLYAGGGFSTVNGATARNYLAALSTSTGTATSFDPDLDNEVHALALTSDGSTLYAGGIFTTVNGATARNNLAAFSTSTGTATSFDPNLDNEVDALALSGDGSTLYAGGWFTTVNGSTTRNRLAAFSTSTGTATSFDPNLNNRVSALALTSDGGTLYAGGGFTTVNGTAARKHLAAFSTSTGTATSFEWTSSSSVGVSALSLNPDESRVAAGGGSGTALVIRNRLLAIDLTTGLVTAFNPNVNGTVEALALSGDGSTLYAGGSFTTVNGSTTRNRLAAFDTTTGTATSFDPNAGGAFRTVYALALSGDGTTIYAGGDFTTVNGPTTRNRLAAFSTTTGTATSFDPDLDNAVIALALSGDGSTLYAGGIFTTVNGSTTRNHLAAFDTTTGTATSFDPNLDHVVDALALTTDGSTLYVGGRFANVNGSTPRNRLAAFDTTTGTATSFDPNLDNDITALALPGDGSTLYVGGDFTTVNGSTTRNRLAAFDTTTGTATSFDPDVNQRPRTFAAGDAFLVGGDFTTVGGIAAPALAVLAAPAASPGGGGSGGGSSGGGSSGGGSSGGGSSGGGSSGGGSSGGGAVHSSVTALPRSPFSLPLRRNAGDAAPVVTVNGPPGTFGSTGVTVRATLVSSGLATPGGFKALGTTLNLIVTGAGAGTITSFDQPIELVYAATGDESVPAYSADGRSWTPIPACTGAGSTTLGNGQRDCTYKDAQGQIHILTLHATYFGLLLPASSSSGTAASARPTPLILAWGVKRALKPTARRITFYFQTSKDASATLHLTRLGKTLATARGSAAANAAGRLTLTLTGTLEPGAYRITLRAAGAGGTSLRSVRVRVA